MIRELNNIIVNPNILPNNDEDTISVVDSEKSFMSSILTNEELIELGSIKLEEYSKIH